MSFSNGLEKHPKLRFPGFDEPWNRCRLSDIGQASSGYGFPEKFQGEHNNEIPFYKVSDMNLIGNEQTMTIAKNYVSQISVEKMRVHPFEKDSIIFCKSRGCNNPREKTHSLRTIFN